VKPVGDEGASRRRRQVSRCRRRPGRDAEGDEGKGYGQGISPSQPTREFEGAL